MKRSLLHTAFALLLLTAGSSASYAQEVKPGNASPFTTEEIKDDYELKTFKAIHKNGKVFVSWTATDATGECVYIIERSSDGTNYQKISVKKGAPSPGTIALMFSYIDEQPVKGRSYYRVQRYAPSGSAYTTVVAVDSTPVKTGNVAVSGLASSK